MLPPGGGTNNVDPRYLSLYVTISILFPLSSNIEKIYNSILSAHLQNFGELKNITTKIT